MSEITKEQLSSMSEKEKDMLILSLAGQVTQLTQNVENMLEQIRLANQRQFGRRTERIDQIEGQLSIFDEAESMADSSVQEEAPEEILPKKPYRKKKPGQRDINLAGFEEEIIRHPVDEEKLNAFYGNNCWRKLPTETYKRLRYEPASWTVEVHKVEVYVGTDGLHQDEFTRGNRPKDLFRNSIVTPSLLAAILNGKYVNAIPLDRLTKEFERNDVRLSKQTVSNWIVNSAERYLEPLWKRLKEELLKFPVNQADETPVQVIHDNDPNDKSDKRGSPGHKNWMWVYRSGEFYKEQPIILYEYQRTRHHKHPLDFYKEYDGTLVTDGLEQYHMLDRDLPKLKNANCWVHARRGFSDAVKAMDKESRSKVTQSVAYQALLRISQFYELEKTFKEMTPEERQKERTKSTGPLINEFFEWAKARLDEGNLPPKGKTMQSLKYCISKEQYLRVFLSDGNVPIDNSASERSIRPFTIGRKNWMFMNTAKGADASAVIYSIAETAKANDLHPYYYFKHILTELPKLCDKDGNIPPAELDSILPWSKCMPEECYKKTRR